MTGGEAMTYADKRYFYRRLAAFIVLAFAWSWTCWLLSVLAKPYSAPLAVVPGLLAGFGPGIAAVAVVGYVGGRAGLRAWLSRCLQWRLGWGWMALAFLLPLAMVALTAAVHVALGGPLGEEFGWRGYALPEMTDRYGWRAASLALGLVWAAWHLPLFFMAGTSQNQTPFNIKNFLISYKKGLQPI
jgi:uncharacterized protein